jgi:hypothetical protein
MRSHTTPDFWDAYDKLPQNLKRSARKAFSLWKDDHFHPSLRFKCVNSVENIWSVRISHGYRALCVVDDETAVWFWIGNHDDYERFFG